MGRLVELNMSVGQMGHASWVSQEGWSSQSGRLVLLIGVSIKLDGLVRVGNQDGPIVMDRQ